MTTIQQSYERFIEVTTPLLLQHYDRIRQAAESDVSARQILSLYGNIYQTFDAFVADSLHKELVGWLTRN